MYFRLCGGPALENGRCDVKPGEALASYTTRGLMRSSILDGQQQPLTPHTRVARGHLRLFSYRRVGDLLHVASRQLRAGLNAG
ncbi:hypothetical protein DPEC_G00202810 [Dallia pectoralis]|uniref:Uncharacterized protein n=1 Tax=Dallia pectoralis TaxID=75939 RepID=A0ACC2G9F3_DALPE|nr:hypothetical protein DPEC_G00202810 [Dallia pectoralis]